MPILLLKCDRYMCASSWYIACLRSGVRVVAVWGLQHPVLLPPGPGWRRAADQRGARLWRHTGVRGQRGREAVCRDTRYVHVPRFGSVIRFDLVRPIKHFIKFVKHIKKKWVSVIAHYNLLATNKSIIAYNITCNLQCYHIFTFTFERFFLMQLQRKQFACVLEKTFICKDVRLCLQWTAAGAHGAAGVSARAWPAPVTTPTPHRKPCPPCAYACAAVTARRLRTAASSAWVSPTRWSSAERALRKQEVTCCFVYCAVNQAFCESLLKVYFTKIDIVWHFLYWYVH